MKNNQIAESFLQKADEFLSGRKFAEAIENYNHSLRFAPNKSRALSEAFAGRAKVFFENQQFVKCLDSIAFAIDVSVCDEMCKPYKALRDRCLERFADDASASGDNKPNFIALAQPVHKRIPFIADCLEVRENDVYGRYIATTKDLNVGDVVVLEEPFYKILDPTQRHARCAICLQQNMLNLFPCVKCSDAMFCSRKCADSVVHRYECNGPKEESFEKLLLQRMFYQAVEITGSLEELQKLMHRQTLNKTIMDFDLSDPADPENDKNRILATTSLAEREPWSAEAYAKYESVTQLLLTDNEDDRNFLRIYLVRCLKSMTVNFFHFFWSPSQVAGRGFALCSLAAYFAHSCDPNVHKIDVDNKFAFIAKKPIKAGEQLFMNYDRYSFLTHSLEARQAYFNKIYTFKCGCSACKDNYPQLADLPKFDDKFDDAEPGNESLEEKQERYQRNCRYIETNMANYPCFEICSLMIQNDRLLHAIGNDLPF